MHHFREDVFYVLLRHLVHVNLKSLCEPVCFNLQRLPFLNELIKLLNILKSNLAPELSALLSIIVLVNGKAALAFQDEVKCWPIPQDFIGPFSKRILHLANKVLQEFLFLMLLYL